MGSKCDLWVQIDYSVDFVFKLIGRIGEFKLVGGDLWVQIDW